MTRDDCGCCKTLTPTPVRVRNRPGLDAVAYRVGTFAAFRQAMLHAIAGETELSELRTRRDDDFAVTLLDQWAVVLDILTFYQERIANEAFLRTARHRDSVLKLAALLDYRLRPGVAAAAYLAFTTGDDKTVHIPSGLRVQSVPGQDEKPQKFETVESIDADPRLNQLTVRPGPVVANPLAVGSTGGYLAPGEASLALARDVKPGDRLVLVDSDQFEELYVSEVRVDGDRVHLTWDSPIRGSWYEFATPRVAARTFRLFGHDAPSSYMDPVIDEADGHRIVGWCQQNTPFAYPRASSPETDTLLFLDARYSDITPDSDVLLTDDGQPVGHAAVREVGEGENEISMVRDTVTKLALHDDGIAGHAITDRRGVRVHELDGRRVRFWGYTYPDEIVGGRVFAPLSADATDTLADIEIPRGRRLLLDDDRGVPFVARVVDTSISDSEVRVTGNARDRTTASELGLDAPSAWSCAVSERRSSLSLPAASVPELTVRMGPIGPRTLRLEDTPDSIETAADVLQHAIRCVDAGLVFSRARVFADHGQLLVLPGVAGVAPSFGPTETDRLTATGLGLDADRDNVVTALASRAHDAAPSLSQLEPEVDVGIGPIGPLRVRLLERPFDLVGLSEALGMGVRLADGGPLFWFARVYVLANRLIIVPGNVHFEVQKYLRLDVEADSPRVLRTRSALALGNVALATHGETVDEEILGDGDHASAFQRFGVRNQPVTFVPSSEPGGVSNTLEVAVNGALWQETASLFGRASADRVYTTRLDDDGQTTVEFGDGHTGARLPTGRGNVVARYRRGSGLAGRVNARTLRTLLDRPKGLRAVTNPAAAEGGADPERLADARSNAPATVRTFQRAVSLTDFEDLVKTSGEVAKAKATWVWNGEARVVHLTVAAQAGGRFSDEGITRIHTSLQTRRDPNHALLIDNFDRVPIVVAAVLRVADTHVAREVEIAARTALLGALSFEALGFGQAIHLSDMYRVLQDVDGVVALDINRLHFKIQDPSYLADRGAASTPVQGHLRIYSARSPHQPVPGRNPIVSPSEQAWVEWPDRDIRLTSSGGRPC